MWVMHQGDRDTILLTLQANLLQQETRPTAAADPGYRHCSSTHNPALLPVLQSPGSLMPHSHPYTPSHSLGRALPHTLAPQVVP